MKFASISVAILLLFILVIGCNVNNKSERDSTPKPVLETPGSSKKVEENKTPSKTIPLPKEQKSDRGIKNEKPKNPLDSLRPKTA